MLLRLGSMLARRGLHAASARFAAAPALRLGRSRALSTAPVDDEMEDDIDVDGVAYGFMASQALFAGLELGIFDAIAAAGGSVDLPSLQRSSGVTAPRLQTLLTALVASKALRRSRDGAYDLSPNAARFLVSSSRHFYGDYLKLQIGRQFYHRMGALTDVMKTGEAPSYASWFSDPEVAATYTRAQHNGSVATAKALLKRMAGSVSLDGASKMLDVGGGSGAFSYVFTGEMQPRDDRETTERRHRRVHARLFTGDGPQRPSSLTWLRTSLRTWLRRGGEAERR